MSLASSLQDVIVRASLHLPSLPAEPPLALLQRALISFACAAALTPLPTISSTASEVEMPRPKLPSPFGDEDASAHQEVVMPRPSMPSPFHDPHARLSPTEDAALPPRPASPFDQPATEGVTLPAPQVRTRLLLCKAPCPPQIAPGDLLGILLGSTYM